jgi:hypothetical protein
MADAPSPDVASRSHVDVFHGDGHRGPQAPEKGVRSIESEGIRRECQQGPIKMGGAGVFGLNLRNMFAWQQASPKPEKDISVIVIWLTGGLGQQDSFDMKPGAPAEIRGEFSPIPTNVPGTHICELLPEMARQAHRYTIVRSMTHGEAAHERGTHNMYTGYRPSPALVYPSFGSVTAHEMGPRGALPPYVCVPTQGSQFKPKCYEKQKKDPQQYRWDTLKQDKGCGKGTEPLGRMRPRSNRPEEVANHKR